MTLRTRNKITRIFTFFTAIMSVFFILFLIFHAFQQDSTYRSFSLFQFQDWKDFLFTQNTTAAIFSILLLMIYAPITGLFILSNFEKTHSSEILYYNVFLLGCFLESSRILIPLFVSWNELSVLIEYSARITFFGEMLSIFCLLGIGVSAMSSEVQDSGRNILLFLIASVFFATLVPINTTVITQALRVTTGFSIIIQMIRIFFICTSTISYIVTGIKTNSKELFYLAIDFLIMGISYSLLLYTSSFFLCFLSALLMSIFTAHFIKNLHTYYMWK
ncbi:MAG: hypothetical protein BKP49_05480 [Treponema sp. CETP13]|nr:MAG: hypothetical protein BKP49_05480 [Treponema sp. CETP13]